MDEKIITLTFEIENLGTIKMELYQEYAPNTVANIVKLVEHGYYNNKVIYGKNTLCLYFGMNSDGTDDIPQTDPETGEPLRTYIPSSDPVIIAPNVSRAENVLANSQKAEQYIQDVLNGTRKY